jgi:hypothetical protein
MMSRETYNQRKIHMVGSNNVLEDQKHDNKSLVHNQRKLLHYTFSQWQSNKKILDGPSYKRAQRIVILHQILPYSRRH